MPSDSLTASQSRDSSDPTSHALDEYDAPGAEGEWLDEDDDDDMDFEPTTDESEDIEFFDPTEDVEAEFHDADDGLSGVEIDFTMEGDHSGTNDDDDGEAETETEVSSRQTQRAENDGTAQRRIQIPTQILQLLGHAGLRQLLVQHGSGANGIAIDPNNDDDDAEDGYGGLGARRRRRPKRGKSELPPVPSIKGRELMDGGTFGASEHYVDASRKQNTRLARKIMSREIGSNEMPPKLPSKAFSQGMIPSSNADTIIHYNSRCYSGQFSDDGNFFFSCAQDFKVRMYDTSNPYDWKYYKTVIYPYGQWTITDATLSPDNRYLAYSSIRSIVCLSPTNSNESSEPWLLDFSNMGGSRGQGGRRTWNGGYSHFGIWSIRFSGDGREIVAGTSDHSVYVYDIETRQSILKISGHNDDVNAVCFGDTSSPHILYSGSDDTLIKVWDRRSMGDSREAGVFMGHTEGLTYVDSKGDGRYVLSNGKDQTMKLWDLRKMMSTEQSSRLDPARYTTAFDYRFMSYSREDFAPHPHDCSLVTYRGHSILKTLIRCHFSPPGSTNSRYVYSGSEDGSVYIYNMDATLAGRVDVNRATHHSRPQDPDAYTNSYAMDGRDRQAWKTCVRDASWHPNAPVIAATSWNGWGMSTGTCTTHTWNDGAEDDEGFPKMGQRVDQRLVRDEDLYNNPRSRRGLVSQYRTRLRSQGVPAAEIDDEEGNEVW